MTFKERLLNELEDLIIKIDRLNKYIETNNNSIFDIDLEIKQLHAMNEYKIYLEYRILKLMN
ncbi:MAG: hypothetical protein J6O41_00225 [Clostridia bacterium]|nr:hypothetical protein [Clostridia bacterium]